MAGEAGTALVVEIAKKTIQPAVDATVRHVGYLINYNRNINNLKERAKDLETTRLDAEDLWDSSTNNNEEASHTSVAWLDKVKAAETAANVIKEATEKQKTGCLSKECLNLKQRYLLSKNAVKKAEEIMQLQIKGKGYASSTKPALPPSKSTGALANDGSKEFKTRSKIMNDVMEALKNDKVSIIGVCGMGGVGKTTLMHELRERVKVNSLFHEVVMTTVSQNPDLSDIRCKIAEMLGLAGVKDKKNDIAVADEIHKRLAGKGRRTLVILDDIWNEISLEGLGIPIGSDRSNQTDCKVVLTSRQKGICSRMQAHTIIPVAVLPPEEAWYLFRKTAGDCVEIGGLKEIAQNVARECGGLPIALVTLAKALSKQDIEIWKDAHFQLSKHSATRIPDMDKKVYSSIKMSFNFLARELPEAMPLLLLCCQHPEDDVISVERLVQYCFALRLLQNVDTLERVRGIVRSLVVHLKSHFLLETVNDDDGFDSDIRVKMHDVIRDVGLKEESDKVSMHTVKQSQDNGYKVGTSEPVHYPSLKILVQSGYTHLYESFFSQMKELRVIIIHMNYFGDRDFKIATVEGLTNLRMLYLRFVDLDEDILSKIGGLTELELLSFSGCRVGSFPRQIGQLHDLKLLDLRVEGGGSHSIPRGILPELEKLEELYLGKFIFTGDIGGSVEGMEGKSKGNIAELKKLSNLKVLQIKLLNPLQLLGLLGCFEKLQRYNFGMVGEKDMLHTYKRSLILREVSVEWILGDRIESIVTRAEQLRFSMIDGWTDPLMIEKFVSLQKLELRKCEHLEYLVCGNNSVFTKLKSLKLKDMIGMVELCHNGNLPVGSLGKLRELYLKTLPKMRRLWVGPTDSLCLVNLREVEITRCGALECIFPHSAAKCLVQLQMLTIEDCGMLTGIVSKGEGTASGKGGEIVEVPSNLNNPSDVITNNSHKVRGFCGMLKGIVSKGEGTATGRGVGGGGEMVEEPTDINILHFPKLREVTIKKTPILRGFCCLDDDYVQPLLSPLVMFPSMVTLDVESLDQLKQIVGCGTTASDWIPNLEDISVESCASLESFFDIEGMADNAHVVSLGKLQQIYMMDLPSLTHIFRCRISDISIPHLQTIYVYKCHKLKNVVASNLIKLLQNLKHLSIEDLEILETVFDFEGLETMEDDAPALLCELQELELYKLPKLEHVCRLAPKEIPVFKNLTKLKVEDCGSLANLFSYSVAPMLEKLKFLIVRNCKSMTEGVTMNEESDQKKIVFRSLCEIRLENLESLSSFCSSEQLEFEFPSLEEMSIISCPEMKAFCYGRLSTETLRGVDFDLQGGEREWKGDLNQTVQHYYASRMNMGRKENDIHADKDDDDEDANNVVDDNYATAQQLNTRVNRMSSGLKQDGVGDNNAENSVDIRVPQESVHDEYIHCGNEVVADPIASKDGDGDGNADGDGPDGNAHCDNEGTPPELITKEFSPNASAQTTSSPSTSTQGKLLSDDSSSNSFVEFQEFKIIINGFIIDSELSSHLRAKYYELCCTRKCYLHQHLHKGINHKLAAEIISQIIDITDGIKASTLSTYLDKFASWDKTLEAFEILGTDVGFIRARLSRLVGIAKQYEIYVP